MPQTCETYLQVFLFFSVCHPEVFAYYYYYYYYYYWYSALGPV